MDENSFVDTYLSYGKVQAFELLLSLAEKCCTPLAPQLVESS